VGRDWKDQQSWASQWIDRIGELFHINKRRVAAWREDPRGEDFARLDAVLRAKLQEFRQACDEELEQEKLHPARKKALTSIVNHWDGLLVFVDHPEVPMDNSEAERTLRGPAMGRKNYWGSGAVWAGELAERCFSLMATLSLAGLNVRTWLTAYLTACAENGGRVPAFFEQLLPWNLTPEQQEAFRQPLSGNDLPADVRGLLNSLQRSASPCGSTDSPAAEEPSGLPPAEEASGSPSPEEPSDLPPPEEASDLPPPEEPSDLPPAEKTTSLLLVALLVALLVLDSLLLAPLPTAEQACLPLGHQAVANSCPPLPNAGRLTGAELGCGTVRSYIDHHSGHGKILAHPNSDLPQLDVENSAMLFARELHAHACRGPPAGRLS
jgi:hypothetical protein